MKAVNLIPAEERKGAGGAAGRSGGAAYVLLAALAVLVAMVSLVAITSSKVSDRRAEVASLERRASDAERRADTLKDYTAFATLSSSRLASITQIAKSRFDWAHVMHEVARTIPKGITLTSVQGATTDVGAAGGPTVSIGGCAKHDQGQTAKLMVSLRQVAGVKGVTLSSSSKPDVGAASASAQSGECPGPTFVVVAQFAREATP